MTLAISIGYFLYWLGINFIVLLAWFIMLNGVIESRFRYKPSILLSFVIVVVTTAGFAYLAQQFPVPLVIGVYARFVGFVLSYVVARDITTWIPETWKFRRD